MGSVEAKNSGFGYALLLIGGVVGAHLFYLRRPFGGLLMIAMTGVATFALSGAGQIMLATNASVSASIFNVGVGLAIFIVLFLIEDLIKMEKRVSELNDEVGKFDFDARIRR
ncbi:hypothetical protein ACEWPM_007375 [Roseovarius sp. S4756]|uniref:hypothetical protein n=1 Tax=Roseovarius maritimus TaxID=3342637 RepID=UPI0037269DAB